MENTKNSQELASDALAVFQHATDAETVVDAIARLAASPVLGGLMTGSAMIELIASYMAPRAN